MSTATASPGQLTKMPKQEVVSVKSLLSQEAYKKRFEEILGKRAGQFMASVTNISRDWNLADAEPQSIIASSVVAASLDLPVDKNLGFAWIVPYKEGGVKRAQFQMGYKGFIQLCLRTGQYERMNGKPINAEAFTGYDSVGEPIIDWEKVDESKPAVGYAFAWKLVTGFTKTCYWAKSKVQAHAQRYSMAYKKDSGPWKTHFDQMALKTVIKNELADWGIMSVELQRAFRHDQGVQVDIDSEVVYPDSEPKRPQLEGPSEDDTGERPPPDPAAAKEAAGTIEGAAGKAPEPEKIENPRQKLQELCKQHNVTDAQLHAWMKEKKLAGAKTEDWGQASDSNMVTVIQTWPAIVEKIKAITV